MVDQKLTSAWSPSLKKTIKDCERWWQSNMVEQDERARHMTALRTELDAPGILRTAATTIPMIGNSYAMEACVAAASGAVDTFPTAFHRAVEFRALEFRSKVGRSLPHEHQPVLPFWSSMMAIGPALLSQWGLAAICANALVAVAEKDQRVRPAKQFRMGWGYGSNDAFLIRLLADAFEIESNYEAANPLPPEYSDLLTVWSSGEAEEFQGAMRAAAEFHISRSRPMTSKVTYEFDHNFDAIFPAELLVVQALRRRQGLPEFAADHLLVDTPWALIRDLEGLSAHPLVLETETRFRRDFPDFR
ncbi:hypothetical protein [Lysobacter sp. CA196]|uniref:hypothetical protein n=1 Tax=Lysobacter sp. CA196 TaxID=3455606 RepID=UPI003F8D5D14